jgi:hypothetical protein
MMPVLMMPALAMLVLALLALPGRAPAADDRAARDALIAELDAAFRDLPEGLLMLVIEEEAPEDYALLLEAIADAYLVSPDDADSTILEIMTTYRRDLASFAFHAPDELVQKSLLFRVKMGEALRNEPLPCRALIAGAPLILPPGLSEEVGLLSHHESVASTRALLRGRRLANEGVEPRDLPDEADWADVVSGWFDSPADPRHVEIMNEVRLEDPLYCAAFTSFQRAIAEAGPPAGPRVRSATLFAIVAN